MTSEIKNILRHAINLLDQYLGLRKLMRSETVEDGHPLAGDRAIEWSWAVANLPNQPCSVLDLGCVQSVLTGIASRLGHKVTAVDLREIEYEMDRVTFLKGDVSSIDFGTRQFDIIINCSMIEHVGLAGRYGSIEEIDRDLLLMRRLQNVLAPSGVMILTIPIGLDSIFAPYHRIYGQLRLPLLLEHYVVRDEEYWLKDSDSRWKKCFKNQALCAKGSEKFYALGLYVLMKV